MINHFKKKLLLGAALLCGFSPATWADAVDLPLQESFFHDGSPSLNDWTPVALANTYKWQAGRTSTSSPSPTSQDGDGGLAHFNSYNASNSKSRLYSPEINTSSATFPVLTFWFYHSTNGSTGNYANECVTVELSKDGVEDWTELAKIMRPGNANGWVQYSIQLKDKIEDSSTFRVAFTAYGYGGYDMAIDNVIVTNDVGAYFKPSDLTVSVTAEGIVVDWTNPEGHDNLTYDIVRYVDGMMSQSFDGETTKPFVDSYTPAGIESVYYTVTLHDGDLTSGTVASEPIKVGSLPLPVTESFAGAKIGNYWSNQDVSNTSYLWTAASDSSNPNASPQDGDGGLCYYNSYSAYSGDTARLVSEPISVASSINPYLSFYFFHYTSGSDKLYVEIKKDNGEWQQIENAEITVNTSGKSGWTQYVFPLADAIDGAFTYQISFKAVSARGFRLTLDNIRVYNDIKPTNVAVAPAEAGGYTITWDAPELEGDMTFDVIRYVNGEVNDTFTNVQSPYTDNYTPEEIQNIHYEVVTNLNGVSDSVATDSFVAGTTHMPVAASFAGNKLDEFWTIENSGTTLKWSTIASSSGPTLSPQDSDGGLLYANCNASGTKDETSRLISPEISASDAVYPVLTFWFYHTTNFLEDDDTLVVEIATDGGEWTALEGATIHRNNGTIGWTEYNFPLLDAVSDAETFRVALKAVSAYGYGMYIDNISIDNNFRVTDVEVAPVEGGYQISWTAPELDGISYELVRYINGEESHRYTENVTSPFTDSYTPEDLETLYYEIVSKSGDVTVSVTTEEMNIGTVKLPLTESFADATIGKGWTVTTTKDGYQWTPKTSSSSSPSASPHDYDRGLLYYNSGSAGNNSETRLISPDILTSSTDYPVVSFWFYHWQTSNYDTSYRDRVVVEVSTDGADWVEVTDSEVLRNANANGWTQYNFNIRSLVEGSNVFRVAVKAISGNGSNMVIDEIDIHNDILEYFKATDATLSFGDEENQYVVDWTNPVGFADDALTYNVVRYVDGEISEEFNDITTKPFIDTYASNGLQKLYYSVSVTADQLTTNPIETPVISIGSFLLPFTDSFAGAKLSDLWEVEFEGSTYKWEAASSVQGVSGTQDNDGGLVWFNTYNASSGATSTLITPPLNTASSTNAIASFWMYGPNGSKAKIEIVVSNDYGEWFPVEGSEIVLGSAKSGWNEYKFDISDYIKGSKTYRVGFKATSDYGSYRLAIDNIAIKNDIAVKNVSIAPVEGGYNVSWTNPEIDDFAIDIVRYIDGEVSETFSDVEDNPFFDEYQPEKIEMLYYTVTLRCGDISAEAVKSPELKIGSVNLPFADNFAGATMNDLWEIDQQSSYSNVVWAPTNYAGPANSNVLDDDGGYLYANSTTYSTRNSWAKLITPPIATASSTNPAVSFWMYHYSAGDDKLKVQVSVDGGEWIDVPGSEVTVKAASTGWVEYTYSLTSLIRGSQTYRVAFHAESAGGQNIVIDNIVIENKAEYDLAVSEISGPAEILAGKAAEYRFTVFNNGGHDVTADDYTVTINVADLDIEPIELQDILAGTSVDYSFVVDYTADHVSDDSYVFTVVVGYEPDEIPENNTSDEFETIVSSIELDTVSEVTAVWQPEGNTITVTWTPAFDMTGYEQVDIHESFEDLAVDTTDDLNGFTTIHAGTQATGSWVGVADTSFKVSEQLKSSYSTGPAPVDGEQYIVAIAKNLDEWLISPELKCDSRLSLQLSFSAYPYCDKGATVEVLYSTSGNSAEDFTNSVASQKLTISSWNYLSFTVDNSAKYVALRFTTSGEMYTSGILVDNVVISDNFIPVIGYHVYEEGVGRVNTEVIEANATSFTFEDVNNPFVQGDIAPIANVDDIRYFTVTALYPDGESVKSVPALLDTVTGVENVIVEGSDADPVYYNLNGVRVDNPSAGIYIVVRGREVTKEIIR